MNFTEYLNHIYKQLNCSQIDLCNAAGISPSVISRYLSGSRIPAANSDQVKALAKGIQQLAAMNQLQSEEFSYEQLLANLNDAILQKEMLYNAFVDHFNQLVDNLHISIKDLAISLNFDTSYLYRIKSGERHPVDLEQFCNSVSEYIAQYYNTSESLLHASKLFACEDEILIDKKSYQEKIYSYLMDATNFDKNIPQMDSFLQKMEEFDLEEYIKVIHFDELKVPNLPFSLPSSKYYYGLADMRKAELDFLKATVLGKSMDSVLMCSYMPMQDMAEDMDFGKKWMFGIAMMIKKGLHLNVIHNLNRPMQELMLGFEAWIPIYMTGQVSPYHIPDYTEEVFHQINNCSGSAALMGECIDGFHENGRYYVTNNKTELAYFKQKANNLLKKAKPLMDIYTQENADRFQAFLKNSDQDEGNRRVISSALPDFTIPEDILSKYIENLDLQKQKQILEYIRDIKMSVAGIMEKNLFTWDIHILSKEEYEKTPMVLHFPLLFSDFDVRFTYEEYLAHLNATKAFADEHTRFLLQEVDTIPFHNIKILIVAGKYFMISKAKSPNIHFVIYHKQMLAGMEQFYLAYQE